MVPKDEESSTPSKPEETRERILLAAAQVFGEQGYARATTRAIAETAGVNEVTLFRHFGNKESLFKAVMEQYGGPALSTTLKEQLTGDYRADLKTIAHQVMKVLVERQDAVRLMLCESTHFPELRSVMAQNPRQLRKMLAKYLEGQMARGQVRELHAEALAQAFWGMFFAYGIATGILTETPKPEIPPEELVELFVDIFVQGTINAKARQ
jgi:AcrR family transcriptional regulator